MIKELKINNIALIKESLICFENGFNVLTGETGAGKSIIIDALNFVLGARAEKSLIKQNENYAKVEVCFEVDKLTPELEKFFSDSMIEPETTIVIKRMLNINGKNDCRINGEIVTLNMLKTLTVLLVDIFGQHDNQFLLDKKNHLKLLDKTNNKIEEEKLILNNLLLNLNKINNNINDLGGIGENKEHNIKLLEYEINEIEMADIKINEEEDLANRKKMILNSEKLLNNLNNVEQYINGGEYAILGQTKNALHNLSNISDMSTIVEDLNNRLKTVTYEIEDILDEINSTIRKIDFSENELELIEERLDLIKDIKKKYGNTIEEINNYLFESKQKLELLKNSEEELKKLQIMKNNILNQIYNQCVILTEIRKKSADILSSNIENELKELDIKNAKFNVAFNNDYNLNNIENVVTKNGADNIEFLFSANSGVDLKPLSKIISGGELSRFMLAFKCVVNEDSNIKTLIFDEIDTGIGGMVGIEVAKKIAKLSTKNQVLCVTHLAQIASFADSHFMIEKQVVNNQTVTSTKKLNSNEKVLEIARMIGVKNTSEYGKLNAKELLENAKLYKQNFNLVEIG